MDDDPAHQARYSAFTKPSTSPVCTFTQPSASGSEAATTLRPSTDAPVIERL